MEGGNSRLVYSTDGGRVRPTTTTSTRSAASKLRAEEPPDDGFIRIRRQTKGRGGKVVTSVTGVVGNAIELDALLKVLKQLCGAGGSRAGRVLELQGDHRERVQTKLEALGHRVKLAGG